jgi:hypothetical protein
VYTKRGALKTNNAKQPLPQRRVKGYLKRLSNTNCFFKEEEHPYRAILGFLTTDTDRRVEVRVRRRDGERGALY